MPERKAIIQKLRQYADNVNKSSVTNPLANTENAAAIKASSSIPLASGYYPEAYNDSPALKAASNTAFNNMLIESRARSRPIASLIDPNEMMAQKSLSFNKYVMDFINDSGFYGNSNPYTEQQLLMAYMTSVYLFAALRRVSNLISRIKVVAEIRQGSKYVRAPETILINRIFERDGPSVYSKMYLNYAIYGAAMAYKTKTLHATLEHARGTPIYDYQDNAVAGLHVLDKPFWELHEDTYNGEIIGAYVQRGTKHVNNRNYLDRREFVYLTDWNPENPNRGRSIATVAIHEAVTNAAIAKWSAEYFTRGAMPFVLVAMEDDPAMISDSDLMKYKRQFEDHWQGINSSLRSVFIDRNVNVQQVGIPASEVAADELNQSALEGISAAVGLDRELIVTPAGGSQERHAVLVKRAWEDTVMPMANGMLSAFARDLGLPDDMRLALDLSHIQELDADRDERVSTEISVFDASAQTYNEMRGRLNMPAIPQFDGMVKTDDGLVPIDTVAKTAQMPMTRYMDAYNNWYDKGLTSFNDYRRAMGMKPVQGMEDVVVLDGKPVKLRYLLNMLNTPTAEDIQRESDMLDKGFRTFNAALKQLGLEPVNGMDDVVNLDGRPVVISEIIKHISTPIDARVQFNNDMLDRGLKSFNDVRSALGLPVIQELNDVFMLDSKPVTFEQLLRSIKTPPSDYIDTQTGLMDRGLKSFNDIRSAIGLEPITGMEDVFMLDNKPVKLSSLIRLLSYPTSDQIEFEMRLLEGGLQSVNELRRNLGRDPIPEFEDWYVSEGKLTTLHRLLRQDKFLDDALIEQLSTLWSDNLLLKSKYMSILGIEMREGEPDGYKSEVENALQLKLEKDQMEMEIYKERKLKELEVEFAVKQAVAEAYGTARAGRIEKEEETRNDAIEAAEDASANVSETMNDMAKEAEEQRQQQMQMDNAVANENEGVRSVEDDDPDDPNDPSGGKLNNKQFRTDGYINTKSATIMYVAPTKESAPSAKLEPEDVIEIVDSVDNGNWLRIRTPDNVYGWIESKYVYTDKKFNTVPDYIDIPEIDDTVQSIKSEERWIEYAQDAKDTYVSPTMLPPEDYDLTEDEAIQIAERIIKEIEEKNILQRSQDEHPLPAPEKEDDSDNNLDYELDGESLYISLWLGDQSVLTDIQSKLRIETNYNPDIDWVDPKTFHVTLVGTKGISDAIFNELKEQLPKKIDSIELNIGPVAAFENDYETVFYVAVRSTPSLEQLQQKLNVIFGSYGISVSEYSDPAKYMPHITMAYASPDTPIPNYDRYETVKPESLVVQRMDYQTIHVIHMDGSEDDSINEENKKLISLLRQSWRKRIEAWRNSGKSSEHMPGEMLDIVKRYQASSVKSVFYEGLEKAVDMGAFDNYPLIDIEMIKSLLPGAVQDNAVQEIRAWEKKAIKSFKDGNLKRAFKFETRHLSANLHDNIIDRLSKAKSLEDIRSIFDNIDLS